MPFKISTAPLAKGVGTCIEWFCIAVCCPCLFCYVAVACATGSGGYCGTHRIQERRKRGKAPKIPPNPPPLPAARIDIRNLPVAEQPQSCYFFQLPLELRECIYQHAFGGRLITLQVVGSQYQDHCIIRSQCYLPVDDLAHGPNRGILPAERLSVALLRACRQVYTEALRILHQRNTFHVWASQLDVVVRSGLGEYCLPDIRSVYIYHFNVDAWAAPWDACPWKTLFYLLQQMSGLERAAFEFEAEPEASELDPYTADNDDAWGRGILGLRNLHRLELWFNYEHIHPPPQHSVDKAELVEKLHQLMIAPGADERYRIFLEHCI